MNDPVDQQQASETCSEGQTVGTKGNSDKIHRSHIPLRENAVVALESSFTPHPVLAALICIALGNSVYAQQSDPFAPAQTLVDGWEQMDQRLIFLMVRLVDVEANLDAVDAAIVKAGGRAASARSAANRAEAGSDRMDRRAGGPVRWDKFYGTTAEKFFYHPTQHHTYHTETILSHQSLSNDNQSESGVPSRQGLPVHQRPPQFDYMYRANENAKERATAEVQKIADKVDALAARRAELELEQSRLWCEVAFRVVSRNDLDKRPLYRFMPKGSGQESLTAAASFVVVALSIVKNGESDQGGAFRQIKPMVSKARSDLGDKWLQLGVDYRDQSLNEWKFASLARYLEDVSSNLSDSYAVSVDSARNSDPDRRDMYRGLLQQSLVQYAQAVLALNEMASEMASTAGFEPDFSKPLSLVGTAASPTSSLKSEQRRGNLADLLPIDDPNVETEPVSNEPRRKTKSKSVRWSPKVNNEKSLKEIFKLDGNWRIELGGCRLFMGSSIETTKTLAGDFTLTAVVNVRIREPEHYWIQIQACGESFAVRSTGNAALRLERKGDKLGFQFGNQSPTVLVIKDANFDKPTSIRMFCVPNTYSGVSEMLIQSINVIGKVSNNELIP